MAALKSVIARKGAFDWFLAVFLVGCILLGLVYWVVKGHGWPTLVRRLLSGEIGGSSKKDANAVSPYGPQRQLVG